MQTAVQHRWSIHSGDVPQAFLKQDPAEWKREEAVYAYPPRGIKHGLGHDTILRLRKAVYGLCDAPLIWYRTVRSWFLKNGWQSSRCDSSVFYKTNSTGLSGVAGIAVDDILWAGDQKASEDMNRFRSKFEIPAWDNHQFRFCGVDIKQDPHSFEIEYYQSTYIGEELSPIDISGLRGRAPTEPLNPAEVAGLRLCGQPPHHVLMPAS